LWRLRVDTGRLLVVLIAAVGGVTCGGTGQHPPTHDAANDGAAMDGAFLDGGLDGGREGGRLSDASGRDASWQDAALDVGAVREAVAASDRPGTDGPPLGEGPWVPIGPAPIGTSFTDSGRVTALAMVSATRFYVVSAGGGVWRTDDAGGSWTALTDGAPTLAGSSIAVDPGNANRIWVGTGEATCGIDSLYGAGILSSTDGTTFTPVAQATFGRARIARIAVDPTSPPGHRTLFAAATGCWGLQSELGIDATVHGGLFESTDDGVTWSALAAFGPEANDVVVDPSGVITATRYAFPPDLTTATGIYQSVDHGASFTKLAAGLPTDWTTVGPIALALAPSNAQVLYASMSDPSGGYVGLYATTTGGSAWSKTAYPATGRQWTYDNVVAVDPTNANTVYVGGVALLKSTDGGATWSSSLPVGQDQHALALRAADPSTILVGNDTGVNVLTSGGSTVASANGSPPNALAITQGYGGDVDPLGVVYVGTQDNGIDKSSTSLNWTHLISGDSGRVLVDWAAPATVYEAIEGYVERSDDGGATWNEKIPAVTPYEAADWLSPLVMDPTTSTTLYLGLMNLWKTTDRGDTWTPLTTAPPTGGALSAIAVAGVAGNDLYVGDQFGAVATSSDGGATWQGPFGTAAGLPQGNNGGNARYVTGMAVDPTTPTTAWATYSGFDAAVVGAGQPVSGQVFRTTDHGATWTDLTGAIGDQPVNWITVDPVHPAMLYVAANQGVYKSLDAGNTWTLVGNGLPNVEVSMVFLNRAGNALYAVTHGRSVYRASRNVP
jgi:photosystem II stability/assembly factor-like uncharacterized protein